MFNYYRYVLKQYVHNDPISIDYPLKDISLNERPRINKLARIYGKNETLLISYINK